MKRIVSFFALSLAAGLLAACSTLSPEARRANINDTAYHIVVADRKLVDSWTAQYNWTYGPADVGVLAANELAAKGWHDVWVFVELVSTGLPESVHFDLFRMYTWRISIYR